MRGGQQKAANILVKHSFQEMLCYLNHFQELVQEFWAENED